MKLTILIWTCLVTCFCQDLKEIFDGINKRFVKYNSIAAQITWDTSINPGNAELHEKTAANYQKSMMTWQQNTCDHLAALEKRYSLDDVQRRQTYLLCRGPKFTYREARTLSTLYDHLQSFYYNVEVCLPAKKNITRDNHAATETAILDYLSTAKQLVTLTDVIPFAAKMVAHNAIDKKEAVCLKGENEFGKLMKQSRDPGVLKWLWLVWREAMVPMREPYDELVALENRGAWRHGYTDIGASWREELEIPNLRQFCRRLYSGIRPLYTLLHGVVRFYLRVQYGDMIPEKGAIPAHLLGNLWSQNWEPLIELISPKSIDFNESIKRLNWTVPHMVKRVEDFYQSMGLPAMTEAFWRESVFENTNNSTRCHGTAADMFKHNDYRLLYCSGTTMEDFYVFHHEFGHIHYYMAYADQPGLFRQANAALHESIGDAIMYGVMTPQHLHRLGLVNDSIIYTDTNDFNKNLPKELINDGTKTNTKRFENGMKIKKGMVYKQKRDHLESTLFQDGVIEKYGRNFYDNKDSQNQESNEFITEFRQTIRDGYNEGNANANKDSNENTVHLSNDEILLLKQALNKIPQIPFALVIDEYRWKYFEGSLDSKSLNKEFWDLSLELQGIEPPGKRDEEYFDIGAKFHVPDNTAYIRYFLSSFIQHQIFEALCRAAVFGRRDLHAQIPDTIPMNRCDIYGSKAAGKLLKDFMSRGNSQHWREILRDTTGNNDISGSSLQRYYRPLYNVLERIVKEKNIPLGW